MNTRLKLFYFPTPNGRKVSIALEEMGLDYEIVPVEITKGAQQEPAFLAVNPNGRIPALTDGEIRLFESGAILQYLGRKTGQLYPADEVGRAWVDSWLFWQMAGLGPMAGQAGYFRVYAPEVVPFAIERYTKETRRLYGVLDARLADRPYIAGTYSIADIACYPWIVPHAGHGQALADHPHLARWFAAIGNRPAVRRTYEGVEDVYSRKSRPVASRPAA